MNTDEFQERLETARSRRCTFDFVQAYFGLDFRADAYLRRDYDFWMRQRGKPDPLKDECLDRWRLEKFLQDRQLLPVKWAALQLGMAEAALVRLRARMQETGPILAYHTSPDLLGKSFEEDLLAQLPQFRYQTPSNHNDFCRRLHEWILEVFDVTVEPVHCATSERVGHQPPEYAKYLDIVALDPVGPRYQLWLDFGKWMTLPPDRCSVLLFAAHPNELVPFIAGRVPPKVPPEVNGVVAGAPR
ncbi:MAG TPA: hypothetical protein VMV69_02125 [Pirellulales bacterium]|nr:hypothetical protein [Pirellulales bacterium]